MIAAIIIALYNKLSIPPIVWVLFVVEMLYQVFKKND